MREKGTTPSDSLDYSILGCVEPIVGGKSDPRQNIGYVNLPKILEVTLHNGRDPRSGELVGIETGDPRDFTSFMTLWNAFTEQVDNTIELLTQADRIAAGVHIGHAPTPFISALLEGSLDTGKSMQEGGAKYNSGGIMGVGIAIVADSLEVLRKYVFDKKEISMNE